MSNVTEKLIGWFLVGVFALACMGFLFGAYSMYQQATSETISISKDRWHCTKTKAKTFYTGKIVVTQKECVKYEMRAYQ